MVYKDKYIIYMDNFQMSHIKLLIYQKIVHKKTMKKDHMNQLDKYKSPYLTFPYSTLSVGRGSHNLPEASLILLHTLHLHYQLVFEWHLLPTKSEGALFFN